MRKRIAVLHDLPSYGGAALMNIIPIMYSLGIEVCPIPTSLFTSHGGFKGLSSLSTSSFMKEYTRQYKELNLSFNGIYLGLFTTTVEIVLAEDFIRSISSEDTLIVLDPILGDNGKLYSFMKVDIVKALKDILKKVDIITPNLTEAYLLLGEAYNEFPSEEEVIYMLRSLSELGPKYVILTSVVEKGNILIYIYDKEKDSIAIIKREKLQGSYPGTGDAFTAIVVGELINGNSIINGVTKAADFVEKGIKIILEKGYNPLEGLPLGDYLYK
ncbi:MAG TPA: pyridoxamine kinase [Clostridiaceae bacterium]